MKKIYPQYSKGSTQELENKLKKNDLKIFNDFMTFVSSGAGKHKQADRRKDILQFYDILEKSFEEITYEDIVSFTALVREDEHKAIWTKKGTLATLSVFLKWKFDDWSKRYKNLDVLKKLQRQLQPNNDKKYNQETMVTPEEIDKLIRSADKLMYKLWISMVGEAGLPYAVQSELRFSDIKIDDMKEGITTLSYHREKNKENFVFPLGKVTTYYLKQWEQEYPFPKRTKDDLIFPSPQDRTHPIRQPSIHTMLNTASKKAGINKHLYQYLIRHSVLSSNYAKNGMTEEVHRKLFGHKSGSKMTKTYSHQGNDETLRKALELLHKVEPLTKEEKNQIKELKEKVETIEKTLSISSRLNSFMLKSLTNQKWTEEDKKKLIVLIKDVEVATNKKIL